MEFEINLDLEEFCFGFSSDLAIASINVANGSSRIAVDVSKPRLSVVFILPTFLSS